MSANRSHPRRLNLPVSHGVYTLGHPMIRIDDNVAGVNISYFGVCNSGTPPKGAKEIRLAGYVPEGETASAPDVQGFKCMPDILCEWKCVNEQACITGDFAAVTIDSYLVCACGGLIEPLTSGQEYQERTNLVNGTLSVGSGNGVLQGNALGNNYNVNETGKNTSLKRNVEYYKKAQFYKDYYGPKLSEYEKKVKFYKDLYTPKKVTKKTYVTKQNLIDIGWNTDPTYLNDDMVNEFNSMLIKYGITEPEQIYHFLSQVMVESDNWYKKGFGDGVVEIGSDSYIISKYEGSKKLGNTEKGDATLFKGAGYLHLTGRYNYTQFYEYMKSKDIDDQDILNKGYECVSEKYAWESAAWYWSIFTPLNEISLKQGSSVTKTVKDNGHTVTITGNSTVFEVTETVNGGTNGIVDRMKYYNLVKEKIKF